MKIVPWKKQNSLDIYDPFSEFEKDFSDIFGLSLIPTSLHNKASNVLHPAVDIVETTDDIEVKVDIPGLDKKDVEISAENGVLTIKGESKKENSDNKDGIIREERFYGEFSRSFSLPAAVDESKIKANLKEGVLSIKLPKREETKIVKKLINIE